MRALTTATALGRHTFGAVVEALAIVAIAITLIMGISLATRSDPGAQSVLAAKAGGGSITVPDGVYAELTVATVSSGASGAMAFAQCYRNGARVYGQFASVDSTGHAWFKLGPTQLWTGGSATCTAELGTFAHGGRWRAQATTTFNVSG